MRRCESNRCKTSPNRKGSIDIDGALLVLIGSDSLDVGDVGEREDTKGAGVSLLTEKSRGYLSLTAEAACPIVRIAIHDMFARPTAIPPCLTATCKVRRLLKEQARDCHASERALIEGDNRPSVAGAGRCRCR